MILNRRVSCKSLNMNDYKTQKFQYYNKRVQIRQLQNKGNNYST
jgi:hypothetical protein